MSWALQTNIAKLMTDSEELLLENEAHNNMLLQAFSRSHQNPSSSDAGFTDKNGSVALLFNGSLIFNQTALKAAPDLIRSVKEFLGEKPLKMVMGPEEIARGFSRDWLQTNKTVRLDHEFSMVLQKLHRVNEIRRPLGQFRRAWIDEADLLASWFEQFSEETGVPSEAGLTAKEIALQMIHTNRLFVWGNNRPASMVGMGGATPKGIRVHSVFTPPEKRGKGLARATVAALSELQLSQGKEFLVLYSDATKPENAALYKQIGYEPIANHFTYFFSSK